MSAKTNWKAGLSRLCLLASLAWAVGMGWYQHNESLKRDDNSVTIQLSKDTQLRIDANGISKTQKIHVQTERLAWVFGPSLLLLALIPAGGWLAQGFRQEGK